MEGALWPTDQQLVPYGATSGAIDAGDALGNMCTFKVPMRGRLLSIKLVDQDDDTLGASAYVSSAPFTAAASDAAFTISVADAANYVTQQTFPATMIDVGSAKVASICDIDEEYYSATGVLCVQLYCVTATPNIASAATMPLLQLYILPLGA